MGRAAIDPAIGLDLRPERTLARSSSSVSVVIPAHNEEATVAEVVREAQRALTSLKVAGEVLVSASGCTDRTADIAAAAGAQVLEAPLGKGAAIAQALQVVNGDVVCLVDADVQYFGEPPLVALLTEPILHGIADACVTDLYWRPLYPQLWLHGFFAPITGLLFPELLAKAGSTPWSGQRAAARELWPDNLPSDFTVDLALLFHWNEHAVRLRPVLADDWVNPQRPKPDLMAQELELIISAAIRGKRITPDLADSLRGWYDQVHNLMATYRHGQDDPQEFERSILKQSLDALHSATRVMRFRVGKG
jgi:glycosyltransferase involved in cell wall biosynthesis